MSSFAQFRGSNRQTDVADGNKIEEKVIEQVEETKPEEKTVEEVEVKSVEEKPKTNQSANKSGKAISPSKSKEQKQTDVKADGSKLSTNAWDKISSKSSDEIEYQQLKKFPKGLIQYAKQLFPDAKSAADAVAAYFVVNSGDIDQVSDDVKELVRHYDGDRTVANLEQRVAHLEKQVSDLNKSMKEIELGVAFLVFDKLGYRRDNPRDARNVDFLEPGMSDLLDRLREQAVVQQNRDTLKNGRPIR